MNVDVDDESVLKKKKMRLNGCQKVSSNIVILAVYILNTALYDIVCTFRFELDNIIL